jgi:hypothetical protein
MEKTSTISIASSVLFERINALLTEQGEMSLPGNLTIKSLKMKGDETWLYAEADVKGPYNGAVILQCKPSFDNDAKRFLIHELNIELGDDSLFAKLAGKFVNNFFAEKVDAVNEKFMALLNDIISQIRSLPLPKGGTLSFNTQSFNLHELRTDARGLHFVAELTGEASLEY